MFQRRKKFGLLRKNSAQAKFNLRVQRCLVRVADYRLSVAETFTRICCLSATREISEVRERMKAWSMGASNRWWKRSKRYHGRDARQRKGVNPRAILKRSVKPTAPLWDSLRVGGERKVGKGYTMFHDLANNDVKSHGKRGKQQQKQAKIKKRQNKRKENKRKQKTATKKKQKK